MKIKEPGKKLYQLRIEKDYSQSYIAESIGVTTKTVSNWENGRSMMGINQINLVAEVLEISPLELIELTEIELA